MSTQPITIFGGMGPQASARMYQLLIEKSMKHPKSQPEIFPHIILRSLAVPDFISSQERQKEAKQSMAREATRANNDDPIAIAIACNTGHLFANVITSRCHAPFVSMIEEVAQSVGRAGVKKVGLLASPTTIRTRLYASELERRHIVCVEPSPEQARELEKIIRAVLAGKATADHSAKLLAIAESLVEQGAEAVILGCTELPLVFPKDKTNIRAFDSLDIVAERLIEIYYQ